MAGPQLPCPHADSLGTTRLFTDWRFLRPDGRVALLAREYRAPAETTDADYPFVLLTGRLSMHFNSRTRTGRSPQLNRAAPAGFLEIHPEDAARLGIAQGDEVEIASRRGRARVPARLAEYLRVGIVFMPWHYGSALGGGEAELANLVTHRVCDIHSGQPEYKFSAVRVTKVVAP